MLRLCECNSVDCGLAVDLSFEEAMGVEASGLIFIAKGCKKGQEETDVLIEERENYSLYREA
jgi:hypothetical protein